jgi:tetratricopeptide (TPR) repeat protein
MVHKVSLKSWTLIVGLAACAGLGWLRPAPCHAQDAYGPTMTPKSSSVSGSIKQGFNKVGNFFVPTKSNNKQSPTDDAISLKTQGKPGPELYSAIARLYEESGKFTEAEQYYQLALKEKADNLPSLLGYARFQENQGRINEAIELYQRAVRSHPKDAIAYNNLGLCFARRGKLNEAATVLSQAVQLEPRSLLYRNNLATVLVDQNRLADALGNLREVHGDAAANYNMGYLLNKKGNNEAAEHYFAQALRIDPNMAPAQKWLNYLHDKSRESVMGEPSNDGSVRLGNLPSPQRFPAKVISPQQVPQQASTTPNVTIAYPTQNPTAFPVQATPTRFAAPPSGPVITDRIEEGPALSPRPDAPPLPPSTNSPQRLPPISLHQPAGTMDMSQSIQYSAEANVAAPLPPGVR